MEAAGQTTRAEGLRGRNGGHGSAQRPEELQFFFNISSVGADCVCGRLQLEANANFCSIVSV